MTKSWVISIKNCIMIRKNNEKAPKSSKYSLENCVKFSKVNKMRRKLKKKDKKYHKKS